MFQYLILAILVVLILGLIYYTWFRSNDLTRRKKYEQCINDSAGTFDDNAKKALKELTKITQPTNEDFFRRGHIIRYNILGGNVDRTNRTQRNAFGEVLRDYTNALNGLRLENNEIDPAFMIYQFEDLHNNLGDWGADPMVADFENAFGRTTATRKEIIETRKQKVLEKADTRAEAVDMYFDDATKYTEDRQNVHDNKVNKDLASIINKLKSTAKTIDPNESIEEANLYIADIYSENYPRNANNASVILKKIAEGNLISTFNESEDRLFAYTWERCKHPRNKKNADLMRESIANSLAESIENGNQVCTNGRVARVLNSLALLDYDTSMTGVMTFEAYRNKIFQETKEIFDREIENAAGSKNIGMVAVAQSFDDPSITPTTQSLQTFKDNIKNEIDLNLDNYKDKFSEPEIETLRSECMVAVDF